MKQVLQHLAFLVGAALDARGQFLVFVGECPDQQLMLPWQQRNDSCQGCLFGQPQAVGDLALHMLPFAQSQTKNPLLLPNSLYPHQGLLLGVWVVICRGIIKARQHFAILLQFPAQRFD